MPIAVPSCVAAVENALAMPGADIGSYSPIAADASARDALGSTARSRFSMALSSNAALDMFLSIAMRSSVGGSIPTAPKALSSASPLLMPKTCSLTQLGA